MLSCFSHVWLCVTLWTAARHAPLSMRFSRQEYWSGLPCPSPGDLPNPGIEPTSLCLLQWQAVSLPLGPPGKSIKTVNYICSISFYLSDVHLSHHLFLVSLNYFILDVFVVFQGFCFGSLIWSIFIKAVEKLMPMASILLHFIIVCTLLY